MSSYEHKQLLNRIKVLSQPPTDSKNLSAWVSAQHHLQFLEDNGAEDEIVVWARDSTTSIQSLVVREDKLHPLDKQALLRWQGNGFEPRADFLWQAETDDVVLEESRNSWGQIPSPAPSAWSLADTAEDLGPKTVPTSSPYKSISMPMTFIGWTMKVPIVALTGMVTCCLRSR